MYRPDQADAAGDFYRLPTPAPETRSGSGATWRDAQRLASEARRVAAGRS